MFSDHLHIIDNAPVKKLFMVAAGLIVICQLVAMALVAEGQVEKAHLREASQVSFQKAMATCIANSRGIDLKDCTRLLPPGSAQASAGLLPDATDASYAADSKGLRPVTLANRF